MEPESKDSAAESTTDSTSDTERQNHESMLLMVNELRRIARRMMLRGCQQLTIQPTDLVNEAYLKLNGHESLAAEMESGQLLGKCVKTMSNVLVDHLRKRKAQRRGGHAQRRELDQWTEPLAKAAVDELEFLEVAEELATLGETRQYHVAFGKIVAGMSLPELAATLGVSLSTVEADLRSAREFLKRRMRLEETRPRQSTLGDASGPPLIERDQS